MKKFIKKIIKLISFIFILKDYFKFKRVKDDRFSFLLKDIYPCSKDKTIKTSFDAQYIYHTSWAARKIKETGVNRHVDISSSLYFSGLVSAFISVDFYDYRPADLNLSNLTSSHADLNKLKFSDASIKSLSCMHTVEHIGLGRYGDLIDSKGDIKAIEELKRVLAPSGSLFFVVPVGKPKINYNAHRIYSFEMIREYFKDYTLKEFSLITDSNDFIINANPELVKKQNYACGCFWFKK